MTTGKYFNRAVMALYSPHIGHVVREIDDKIVVFGGGGGKERYDIPSFRDTDYWKKCFDWP
jgi:hypothetical protein